MILLVKDYFSCIVLLYGLVIFLSITCYTELHNYMRF